MFTVLKNHAPGIEVDALVYAETRSYQETARRLRLDRRTVKSKVDQYKTEGR